MTCKTRTMARGTGLMLAMLNVASNGAAAMPVPRGNMPGEAAFQRVDTRAYRHCHNNEGRFAVCYTRKPGEPAVSPDSKKRDGGFWWRDHRKHQR